MAANFIFESAVVPAVGAERSIVSAIVLDDKEIAKRHPRQKRQSSDR
jgi:hypothetical protein